MTRCHRLCIKIRFSLALQSEMRRADFARPVTQVTLFRGLFGKIARIDGGSLWKIKVRREVHPSSLSQAVDLTNVYACLNATVQKGCTLTP